MSTRSDILTHVSALTPIVTWALLGANGWAQTAKHGLPLLHRAKSSAIANVDKHYGHRSAERLEAPCRSGRKGVGRKRSLSPAVDERSAPELAESPLVTVKRLASWDRGV